MSRFCSFFFSSLSLHSWSEETETQWTTILLSWMRSEFFFLHFSLLYSGCQFSMSFASIPFDFMPSLHFICENNSPFEWMVRCHSVFFCSSCFSSFILNANESLDRWSLISVHASQNTKHPYIAAFSSLFLFIHPTNGKIWNPNGKRKKKVIIRNKKMELLPRQMVWIKRDSIALNGVFSFTFIFFFCSLSPWRNDVVCQPISYGTKRKFDDENF